MKGRIYIFLWGLVLFFGRNVQTYLGIGYNAFYGIIVFISILLACHNSYYIKQSKAMLYLVFLLLICAVNKLSFNFMSNFYSVINIIGATAFFFAFPKKWEGDYINLWKSLTSLLFAFFIVECSMAIGERLLGFQFLGFKEDYILTMEDIEVSAFRSSALCGHPLGNALIVSIIMTFILFSPIHIKYKMGLWSMGYVSILCFNTRSSIIVNAVILLAYLLYCVFLTRGTQKIKTILATFIVAVFGIFLLFKKDFGGRLLQRELFDASTMTRVNSWNLLEYLKGNVFWWGCSGREFEMIREEAGLFFTENFFINWLFTYGVPFVAVYILLYFFICKRLYTHYSFGGALFTSSAAIAFFFANNSLSSSFLSFAIFLMCIEIFDPKHFHMCFPEKYLDTDYLDNIEPKDEDL